MSTTTPPESEQRATAQKPPCISCRLKRKKCDRKRPICSRCVELQVPMELCIYRENNGLYDKEATGTLNKEIRKNTELKQTVERLALLRDVARSCEGRADEVFTLKKSTSGAGKLLQLNPLRNPLFCTLLETNRGTQHMGSISIAALVASESRIKLMVNQVNNVLLKERQKYDVDVSGMERNQIMLDVFEERCSAALAGISVHDGDHVIASMVAEIESKIPVRQDMENFLYQFTQQNGGRWIGVPYIDTDILRENYEDLIHWDGLGRAHFKLILPDDRGKLEFMAFFLIFLAWMTFMRSSRISPRLSQEEQRGTMNYVLFARYSRALLQADVIGDKIKLGDLSMSPTTTRTLLITHLFERYSAVSNYLREHDYQAVTPLTTKRLVTMAKAQHLHEDIDRWYPRRTSNERRSLRSLWYNIVLLDLLDCLESGTLSSIQPVDLMQGDGESIHPYFDAVSAIHWVIYDFNFIDDVTLLDDVLHFIETSSIPKLKKVYEDLKVSSDEGTAFSKTFDSSRYDDKNYVGEHLLAAQRAMLRYLIFSTISALYHVCLQRFIQNGEPKTSERYQRVLLLSLKYALASLQLYKLHLKVLNQAGNGKDPLKQSFHFSVILFLNPFVTVAFRRATILVFTVLFDMLGVDFNSVAKYILYGSSSLGHDEEIMDMLKEKGLTFESDNMTDFEDFAIDLTMTELTSKWGRYSEPRVLVATVATLFGSYTNSSKMECLNVSFVKMSKAYALGVKFFSYCLNTTFDEEFCDWRKEKGLPVAPNYVTQSVRAEFQREYSSPLISPENNNNVHFGGSFKDFFDSSIATKTQEFSFLKFFGSHVEVPKDDIEEYFRRANEQ